MRKISRRAFTIGVSTAMSAPFVRGAHAQSFATQDVHFICGFGKGTGADQTVRFFAERMKPMLGRDVVIDNVEDGYAKFEGVAATEHVARAKPDGHTIFITPGAIVAANQHLIKNPTVDAAAALRSFGTIQKPPNTLIVAANSPYKTLAELTEAMKAKGVGAKYGVPNGSVVRVIAGMYRKMATPQATETVYHASTEVVRDLGAGVIDFGFSNNVFSVAQERAGKVRILAVSLPERLHAAPQYATFAESGYKIDVDGWWCGFVPAATPMPIVQELNNILNTVVGSEDAKKFLNATIADPWIESADQAQAHFLAQIKAWGEYVQIAGIEKQG